MKRWTISTGTRSGPLPTSRSSTRKCSAGPRIADDEETFVADARSIVEQVQDRFGVEWDEELLRLFARESAETYRLREARGVRFSRLIPRPRQHSIDRMAAVEDCGMLGRAFEPDFAAKPWCPTPPFPSRSR